jgi:hypothetical protein
MSTIMIPTVGRKVYFYADKNQRDPIDATIIKVWDPAHMARPESAVNLAIVDPFTAAVTLKASVSVGNENTPYSHYRWMDYQIKAAKAAAQA